MDSIIANAWYVAMWSEALAAGHTSEREIAGQNVVVYRQPDGTVAALENRCPHQFAPLHMGHVCENGNLRCGYHGLQFDANGACVHNPHGRGSIAPTMKVRTFPIVERHSLIWPRWPVQIPPPVATPNSPGKTGWIMTTQCRWRCVRRPL